MGIININHIYPILIPAGLVALVGTLAIISFMVSLIKEIVKMCSTKLFHSSDGCNITSRDNILDIK